MDSVGVILGSVLLLVGLIGCVVPIVPGPLVAYGGLLSLLLTSYPISAFVWIAGGVITLVATLLDYIVPAMGAKRFKCSKWGIAGCLIGSIVGLFFFPFGIILGPFIGAIVGELIAGRPLSDSVHGGLGALLGFVLGLGVKLAACSLLVIMFIWVVCHA